RRFREQGYGQLLEGVEGNPLPASCVLRLRAEIGPEDARSLARTLARSPEVSDWSDSGELAERLQSLTSFLRVLTWSSAGFLSLMLSFVVAATVRLALASRRDEMEILQLIGATPGFLRLPF